MSSLAEHTGSDVSPRYRSLGPIPGALGFAMGVGLFHTLPVMPPIGPLALLATVFALAAIPLPMLRPLLFALLGAGWAQLHACSLLCDPFPEGLVRQDVRVEGRIVSLPETRPGGATRFLFRVDRMEHGAQQPGFRGVVRLSWYRDAPSLRVGERYALTVRLKPPHGFANPGGFDYERWLFQQGIRATGYVRERAEVELLDAGPGLYVIDRWRQHLRGRLLAVLDGSPAKHLVLALVLGDRSGMTPEHWEVLTRTGTNHLVAISGLHVGLVAASLFLLLRLAWACSVRLIGLLAAPRAAALGALGGAFVYSAMAGFAVSTQRALIMLAVVLAALFWSRTLRPASGFAFALTGVLLVDPTAVLSYGFWLSFGAVAALLYGLGNRPAGRGLWRRWGSAQWAVALGLLPLLMLVFGRASLIAPLVNLGAVPLFSLLLLPLVLVSTLVALVAGIDGPLLWTASILEGALDWLTAIAAWDWAAVSISARPSWAWVAAFSGAFLLLSPRGLPGRWLGVPLLLPLVLLRPPAPTWGDAWFRLLDVGQGLSAVVRTARHTLIYDTGPGFQSGFNTGTAVLLPFLRQLGVGRVDTLILSHGDRDHTGGLAGLASGIAIDHVLAGEASKIDHPRVRSCRAGQRWTWDGIDFEILHPGGAGVLGNDSSCVLRVASVEASLLLPGDIERGVESELVASMERDLTATLLVAAHHGSATSSSRAFLARVSPSWVLYASGYANRFAFPSPEVRDRVADLGATELDTAQTGAIWFALTTTGLEGPALYRQDHPRLWHHRTGSPDFRYARSNRGP